VVAEVAEVAEVVVLLERVLSEVVAPLAQPQTASETVPSQMSTSSALPLAYSSRSECTDTLSKCQRYQAHGSGLWNCRARCVALMPRKMKALADF
jgi:hypothetical protein